jgi:hypothetical protein
VIRYRNDSDERACGGAIPDDKFGPLACLRTSGHLGECIAIACDAAVADGVCFGCRIPLGSGHRDDCYARKESVDE